MGSVYQLSKLKRTPSGAWKGRKAYQHLYGPGCEAIYWAAAGTTPQQAKARFAEWQALIERRIAALREAGSGRGQDLSQRQAGALAGEWYRWFISLHEENPGEHSRWAEMSDVWENSLIDAASDPETGELDVGGVSNVVEISGAAPG
ncbi:MAG TPA: hypothetical protein VGJ20_21335 [Xanthobacteraceae bacterium]